MPRLPDISEQRGPIPSPPTGGVSYPVDFSGAIGGAKKVQQAGRNIATGAEILDRELARIDNDMAEEAINTATEYELELAYGEDGYLRKSGGDALKGNLLDDYRGRFEAKAELLIGGLGNSRQKEFFQKKFEVLKAQMSEDIFRHIVKERQVHASNVYESTIEAEMARAASKHNNQGAIDFSSARIENIVRRRGGDLGWTEEQVAQEIEKKKDALHAYVVNGLMVDAPMEAYKYVERNKDNLSPGAYSKLTYQTSERAVQLAERWERRADKRTKEAQDEIEIHAMLEIRKARKEGVPPPPESHIDDLLEQRGITREAHGRLLKQIRGEEIIKNPIIAGELETLAKTAHPRWKEYATRALHRGDIDGDTYEEQNRRWLDAQKEGGPLAHAHVRKAMKLMIDNIRAGQSPFFPNPEIDDMANAADTQFTMSIIKDPSQDPFELADSILGRIKGSGLPFGIEKISIPSEIKDEEDVKAKLREIVEQEESGEIGREEAKRQYEELRAIMEQLNASRK